jgi:hypothetical protein
MLPGGLPQIAIRHASGGLRDVLDALQMLIGLKDPDGVFARAHEVKVAELGGFGTFIEWTPVPEGMQD